MRSICDEVRSSAQQYLHGEKGSKNEQSPWSQTLAQVLQAGLVVFRLQRRATPRGIRTTLPPIEDLCERDDGPLLLERSFNKQPPYDSYDSK